MLSTTDWKPSTADFIASSNGIKSAAFSCEFLDDVDDPLIRQITSAIASELISGETPQATLLNVNFPSLLFGKIGSAEESAPTPSLLQMKLEQRDNGGYEIMSRLAVGSDGSTVPPGTDIDVLMRGRISITAVNGNNLSHIPGDPSVQRMIAAANRLIG